MPYSTSTLAALSPEDLSIGIAYRRTCCLGFEWDSLSAISSPGGLDQDTLRHRSETVRFFQ